MKKKKVNGVILIDKPKGITSQQVVSKVKYLFMSPMNDSKKAGHTGTLDPMATGLLPICLGEATKFSHYQLDSDKSYEAVIKLGERTDTGDADGQVIEKKPVEIDDGILQQVKNQFIGNLNQIPPMYSALKKDGKKLYEYAREGKEVDREPRPIVIKHLTLELVSQDQIRIIVTCSKGTYIRVLGENIAESLKTVGHLISLRRTKAGGFDVSDAITIDALEQLEHSDRLKQLLKTEICLSDMPSLMITDEQVARIRNGQRLNVYELIDLKWFDKTDIDKIDVKLYSPDIFVGLAILEKTGRLQPKKIVNLY